MEKLDLTAGTLEMNPGAAAWTL